MDGLSLAQGSSSASGGAAGATDGVKKYNKSSFFDEISCDVLDRAAGIAKALDGPRLRLFSRFLSEIRSKVPFYTFVHPKNIL